MITKDMTVGKPWRLILTFSLPLIAGNIFQELYSVVDTMVVGKFLGYQALAAVGVGGWITWMLLSTVQGLCQGYSVPVTNAFGSVFLIKSISLLYSFLSTIATTSFLEIFP